MYPSPPKHPRPPPDISQLADRNQSPPSKRLRSSRVRRNQAGEISRRLTMEDECKSPEMDREPKSCNTTFPPPVFNIEVPATAVDIPLEEELPGHAEAAKRYEASKLRLISRMDRARRDYQLACRRLERFPTEMFTDASRGSVLRAREARVREMAARIEGLRLQIAGIEKRRAVLAQIGADLERNPDGKEERAQKEVAERRRELGRSLVMERRAQNDAKDSRQTETALSPW